jgi:inosine-uridine nucleoside N-ribohydrolase
MSNNTVLSDKVCIKVVKYHATNKHKKMKKKEHNKIRSSLKNSETIIKHFLHTLVTIYRQSLSKTKQGEHLCMLLPRPL